MAGERNEIQIQHVKKKFQIDKKTVTVLQDIDLTIRPGEIVSMSEAVAVGRARCCV